MTTLRTDGSDGGAAYPPAVAADGYEGPDGMSLRDYFAGQALAGMIAGSQGLDITHGQFAENAYALADAMIAARA